jgi:hypothetical protein
MGRVAPSHQATGALAAIGRIAATQAEGTELTFTTVVCMPGSSLRHSNVSATDRAVCEPIPLTARSHLLPILLTVDPTRHKTRSHSAGPGRGLTVYSLEDSAIKVQT